MYFIGFRRFFKHWVGARGCGARVYVLGVLINVVILLVLQAFWKVLRITCYVRCVMQCQKCVYFCGFCYSFGNWAWVLRISRNGNC